MDIKFYFLNSKSFKFLVFLLLLGVLGAKAQPEKDGNITVSQANTVVNRYARVVEDVLAGNSAVKVNDINDLNRDGISYLPAGYVTHASGFVNDKIGQGDLILLYQAQGALINTENSVKYGEVTDYNGAGRYEMAYVESVNGNTINLSCGTKLSYFAKDYVQVIRVPQYFSLTVNAGASIVPVPWGSPSFGTDPDLVNDNPNGILGAPSSLTRRRGGFTAVYSSNVINNGSINANNSGFRGGTTDPYSNNQTTEITWAYRSVDPGLGAEKGESIAGYRSDYDDVPYPNTLAVGRWGRGAPANGGGGGNAHNAGGGGGANGGSLADWFRGSGIMNDFEGACGNPGAWALDPMYIANGNKLTTSSGGGRGGYTFGGFGYLGSVNENACVVGPSYAANEINPGFPAIDHQEPTWEGDYRDAVGGLGGRPIASSNLSHQIFFGGGGGAGDGNDDSNSDGGDGGGIVFLIVKSNISGTGIIQANGESAPDTRNTQNDAPGGGGGGGTVLIQANTLLAGQIINADGGKGGSQLITNLESEGPGGGGGGGVIALNVLDDKVPVSQKTVKGGLNGQTSSAAMTEFPANGATSGGQGSSLNIPVKIETGSCITDLQIIKVIDHSSLIGGENVVFTLMANNLGSTNATNVKVTDVLPSGYTFVNIQSATKGSWTAPVWNVGSLASGESAILTMLVKVKATGSFVNSASIAADQNDSDLSNNVYEVKPTAIGANDDAGTVNGYVGGTAVTNVLSNDGLNSGVPALTTVNLEQLSTSDVNVNLDLTTGAVIVLPQTPAGTYTLTYRITSKTDAVLTTTAKVTVTVTAPPIKAVDDVATIYNNPGGIALPGVLENDTYNLVKATLTEVSIAQLSSTDPANVTINPLTGEINVVLNTPVGVYEVVYEISDKLNPTNVSTAKVTITVLAPEINALRDVGSASGKTEEVAISNILINDEVNGDGADLTNVSISNINPIISGVQVDPGTGEVTVSAGTAPGVYTLYYTITDKNIPSSQAIGEIEVTVTGYPGLGLAKRVVDATQEKDGSYTITYAIVVKNTGNIDINAISVKDDLSAAFPAPMTTSLVGSATTSGTLVANASFDGVSDTELLDPSSTLTPGKSETITFTIKVEPNKSFGTFLNKAEGKASSAQGDVTDISVAGSDTDPDGNGDPDEDEETPVDIKPLPIFIPEGFSPNNDGKNDLFVIDNLKGNQVSLEVYNRWGNLVYKNSNYQNEWDGRANQGITIGKDLPDGTYYYIIVVNGKDKFVNYITLKR